MRNFLLLGAVSLALGAISACSGKSFDMGGAPAAGSANGGNSGAAGTADTSAGKGGSAAGAESKPGGAGGKGGTADTEAGAGGGGGKGGAATGEAGAGDQSDAGGKSGAGGKGGATNTGGGAGTGGNAAGGSAGAPSTGITPDQLPGLALWLDASVGVTASAAHRVSAWADRSTHHNDAALASTTGPLLVTEIINDLPVIHFDGLTSQATLSIPDSGSLRWGTADFSLQIVAEYSNTTLATPRYGMLYGKFAVATPFTGLSLFASYPTTVLNTGLGAQLDSDTQTLIGNTMSLNDGKARLYGVRRVSGKVTVQVNASDDASNTWVAPDDVSAPGRPAYIGSQPGNQYLIGDIAEIVAVSGALSADEHTGLTKYLMEKYKL